MQAVVSVLDKHVGIYSGFIITNVFPNATLRTFIGDGALMEKDFPLRDNLSVFTPPER